VGKENFSLMHFQISIRFEIKFKLITEHVLGPNLDYFSSCKSVFGRTGGKRFSETFSENYPTPSKRFPNKTG
jgi:hypothetical protein